MIISDVYIFNRGDVWIMAKLFSAGGVEITQTSKPSLADYCKRYGSWVEVLANGGHIKREQNSGGIISSSGELHTRFGKMLEWNPDTIRVTFAYEVINNDVDMRCIGYMAPNKKDKSNLDFLNLERAVVFTITSPDSSSNDSPNNSSKKCYVATSVYGTYDCPEVWTLRRYRDYSLAATWHGRAFIRTYYAVSPIILKWFGKSEHFKRFSRNKLEIIVKKLQSKGVEDTPYNDGF